MSATLLVLSAFAILLYGFAFRIGQLRLYLSIAKEGLNSLYAVMPYVFMFVPEIQSICVLEYKWEFKRGSIYNTQIDNIKVQEVVVRENERESYRYVASIQGERVSVAAEVDKNETNIWIKEFSDNLPRIFCDFPLVGTEGFAFPAVVNSSQFNPTEPRNGIFLKDVDETETNDNKILIREAVQLYKGFLTYISNRGWRKIYNYPYKLIDIDKSIRDEYDNTDIRYIKTIHNRNGKKTTLDHICLKIME